MEMELQLKPRTSRMALWIGGLVGLAAGFGFNAMILVWALWKASTSRYFSSREFTQIIVPLIIGALACGLLLGLWTWKGRWLRRRPTPIRLAMAVVCWGLSIASAVVFFRFADN